MLKTTTALLFLLAVSACSKDAFKRYEKRIIGDWQVEEIKSYGFGSLRIDFGEGDYRFSEDRSFSFTGRTGTEYRGKWEIRKYWEGGNCDDCSSDRIRTLMISAVNDQSGELKSDYFNDIQFTGTDRFNATMANGSRTRVFKFRRK
ncbi:hypothetical protein [Niabella beijingensis]|uniref:hypothetical protein n=1 Tax=Niabella beijingensis TaxID=2872700 RepID=UPI001CC02CAD|nr:hypothetical protein [Niabella beijingensis]MBZ4190948.1 hypothetical protein [Niabella beijingensis]